MKLLIIEGTDGAGKTSLWKKLRNEHKGDPRYFFWTLGRVIPTNGMPIQTAWLHSLLSMIDATQGYIQHYDLSIRDLIVITDRSFIGSHIYGKVMQDKDRLYVSDCIDLLDELARFFSRIDVLLLTAKSRELRERIAVRGDDYISPDEAIIIQKYYLVFMTELESHFLMNGSLPVLFHYATNAVTKKSKRELANQIINESI